MGLPQLLGGNDVVGYLRGFDRVSCVICSVGFVHKSDSLVLAMILAIITSVFSGLVEFLIILVIISSALKSSGGQLRHSPEPFTQTLETLVLSFWKMAKSGTGFSISVSYKYQVPPIRIGP